jgi:DNA-binding MurR/RpiR family transcriptional regulator
LPRVRNALPKNINFQNAVVDWITENPQTSTRAVAATLNVSQSTIIRTLKSLKFHPYEMILQLQLHGVFIPELKGVWKLMVEINFEHLI